MNTETRLWFTDTKSGKKSLMATITPTSRFKTSSQKELKELLKTKTFQEVCEAAKSIVCY